MAQTRANPTWRFELRYRGAVRHVGVGPVVRVGEGGELVVPGLGGVHVLADGPRLHAVPGLVGTIAADAATLQVVAHPEIEIAIERVVPERIDISRTPAVPWREAVYGIAFAACVSAFIGVKVAASPLRQKSVQDRDRELVTAWLEEVPIAVVPPLPIVELAPPPPSAPQTGNASEPAGDDGLDDARIETPEVASNAEVDEKAPPRPKKLRRRQRDDAMVLDEITALRGDENYAVLSALGSTEDNVLGGLIGASIDDVEGYGGLGMSGVGVAPAEVPSDSIAVREREPDGVSGGVVGGVPGGVVGGVTGDAVPPQVLPADESDADVEGVAGKPACELEFDPKPRLDVVFVVDATQPMSKTLANLARQIGALQDRVSATRPRYGLVAFADDVQLARLDALTEAELRVAIAGLSADAQVRPEEPDTKDDVLGALDRAREFPWGDTRDTLRMIVLVTDADYADKGEQIGEHTVAHSHDRIAKKLAADSIRVVSMTHHPVPGLDRGRRGRTSLPEATAGLALDDSAIHADDGLADALGDLLRNPVCKQSLIETIVD